MSTDEANTHHDHSHKGISGTVFRCIGLYVAGWLFYYFGVNRALLEHGQTGKWQFSRDPAYAERFLWAALTLVQPAIIGFFLMCALIPLLAILVWLLELPGRWRSK